MNLSIKTIFLTTFAHFIVHTLTKGFILERLWILFLPILLCTFLGYLSIPATKACPYGFSEVPSSQFFTTMALRPAYRPLRTSTTFPGFIILPILDGSVNKHNLHYTSSYKTNVTHLTPALITLYLIKNNLMLFIYLIIIEFTLLLIHKYHVQFFTTFCEQVREKYINRITVLLRINNSVY